MNESEQDEKIGNEYLYRALRLTVECQDEYCKIKPGHGTGFIVRSHADGRPAGEHFLVTNRHVVDRTYSRSGRTPWGSSTLVSIRIDGYFQRPRYPNDLPERTSLTMSNPSPVYPTNEDLDVAVIALPSSSDEGKPPERIFNSFPIMKLQSADEIMNGQIQVGSSLLMPGYPELAELEVSDRPVLVGGWIASDPRYSASIMGVERPRRVLGHSFSRAGMSGAPALGLLPAEIDWMGDPQGARVTLLGINTGHVHLSNEPSVISEFVPAPAILSTIAKAGDAFARSRVESALRRSAMEDVEVQDLWLPEPLSE
nr:hypothetical protein [Rhodococcus erythropolis]